MWHLSTLYSIHNRTHCFSILRKETNWKYTHILKYTNIYTSWEYTTHTHMSTHTTHIHMYTNLYNMWIFHTHTSAHTSKHTHHAQTQSTHTHAYTHTLWKITFIRGDNACPSESILLLADHVRSKLLGSQVRINVSVMPELLWFMPFNLCVHFVR